MLAALAEDAEAFGATLRRQVQVGQQQRVLETMEHARALGNADDAVHGEAVVAQEFAHREGDAEIVLGDQHPRTLAPDQRRGAAAVALKLNHEADNAMIGPDTGREKRAQIASHLAGTRASV